MDKSYMLSPKKALSIWLVVKEQTVQEQQVSV